MEFQHFNLTTEKYSHLCLSIISFQRIPTLKIGEGKVFWPPPPSPDVAEEERLNEQSSECLKVHFFLESATPPCQSRRPSLSVTLRSGTFAGCRRKSRRTERTFSTALRPPPPPSPNAAASSEVTTVLHVATILCHVYQEHQEGNINPSNGTGSDDNSSSLTSKLQCNPNMYGEHCMNPTSLGKTFL